jgi:membrane protein required for beta-lactamase induction
MDESNFQNQLYRIRQRQYLILVLLIIPYLLGIAELIGVWIASVLYTVFGLVVFATVVFYRRRSRNAAGR